MNAFGWLLLYAFVVSPLLAVFTGKALGRNSRRYPTVPSASPASEVAAFGETPLTATPQQWTAEGMQR